MEIIPNVVYTAQQTRQILGIGKTTMAKYVREGKLKPVILGKSYRFLGEYLINFLKFNLKQ